MARRRSNVDTDTGNVSQRAGSGGGFDADGVPVGGGDYANQAARQIITLADSMRTLGIAIEEERLADIRRNSRLLGYLPRPKDFEMETTVLDRG